ncbi:MAG: HAD family hydrolase [Bifidobacteriaceae bacterium]|nr:HAD family hydrolase [Bifidobacteriaceae bacterium]
MAGSSDGLTLPDAVFWDMDGTLINSDPYWLEAEHDVVTASGATWSDDLPRLLQGCSLPDCVKIMQAHGVDMDGDLMVERMVGIVEDRERERLPWTAGVVDLLAALAAARIPSVLVTGSPATMAENVVANAPAGAFVGYVSNETTPIHKPEPEPYLKAAEIVGVNPTRSLIFEDSLPGLESASRSGALTVAVTRYSRESTENSGFQFTSIYDYENLAVSDLGTFMRQRDAGERR